MEENEITNHALVEASKEHITHKMVARARKGRRLTSKVKNKITRAFNIARKSAWKTVVDGLGEDEKPDPAPVEQHPKNLFNY